MPIQIGQAEPGFDNPLGLLSACHRRVERFLAALARVARERRGGELTDAERSAFDTIVAGPLCESGDVFTQEEGGVVTTRKLPEAVAGDYLILHDAGAYGAAMSSNYNTRKLAVELMIHPDGSADVIRERQTFEHILHFERVPEALR